MLNRNKIEFNDNKYKQSLNKDSQKNNKYKIYIIYRLWFAWGETWTKVLFLWFWWNYVMLEMLLLKDFLIDVVKNLNFLFGKHQGNKLKGLCFLIFQFSSPNNILTTLIKSEKVKTIIIKNFCLHMFKEYS